MKKILGISVPHTSQTYPTVGNYQNVHGCSLFTISEMPDERYELLVFLHEFVEKVLVEARGIPLDAIDAFDIGFERDRQDGDDREPGWEPSAPYHREHVFAEQMERLLAAELGVDWDTYDRTVTAL